MSIQNPASDNVDESLLADHDDSNICDVPSKHIEDNGKFKNLYFHWFHLLPLWKHVMIKFNLQIKLKLKSEVHKFAQPTSSMLLICGIHQPKRSHKNTRSYQKVIISCSVGLQGYLMSYRACSISIITLYSFWPFHL